MYDISGQPGELRSYLFIHRVTRPLQIGFHIVPIYKLPVTLQYPIGSLQGVNTWHMRKTTVPIPGPDSISTIIKNFYDAIKAMFPTTMTVRFDGQITQVDSGSPDVAAALDPWSVTGTSAGSIYGAAGVGACVGWRTTKATRSGRGRTFLAPLSANQFQADGTLVDSYLVTLRAAAQSLCTASLSDGNGAVSVWSVKENIGRDVVTAKVNDRVAWLKSRRS